MMAASWIPRLARKMTGLAVMQGALATENFEDLFELDSQLADDLLALTHVRFGLFAGQSLPSAADREPIIVEKTANLSDDQYVLTLIITTIAAPLYGLELRKLLLPVAQHVRLDETKLTDFTNGKVALAWDSR